MYVLLISNEDNLQSYAYIKKMASLDSYTWPHLVGKSFGWCWISRNQELQYNLKTKPQGIGHGGKQTALSMDDNVSSPTNTACDEKDLT